MPVASLLLSLAKLVATMTERLLCPTFPRATSNRFARLTTRRSNVRAYYQGSFQQSLPARFFYADQDFGSAKPRLFGCLSPGPFNLLPKHRSVRRRIAPWV